MPLSRSCTEFQYHKSATTHALALGLRSHSPASAFFPKPKVDPDTSHSEVALDAFGQPITETTTTALAQKQHLLDATKYRWGKKDMKRKATCAAAVQESVRSEEVTETNTAAESTDKGKMVMVGGSHDGTESGAMRAVRETSEAYAEYGIRTLMHLDHDSQPVRQASTGDVRSGAYG